MLRHLRIGNVRDNKLLRLDGTNKGVYKVQILGTSKDNNLMHGVLNNNLQDGMHKILLLNNRPQGGAHKLPLPNNNLPAGDKTPLNNNLQGGVHKTQLPNSLLHGMHKILLLNNLLRGTLQVQEIWVDSNNGMHPLLPIHGRSLNREHHHGVSRVINLLLQHMGVEMAQANSGHNPHK